MKLFSKAVMAAMFMMLPAAAFAADLPAKAPPAYAAPAAGPNWGGLYLDLYLGYAGNLTDSTFSSGPDSLSVGNVPHGPGVGGDVGYNIQNGRWVYGFKVDASYWNLSGNGGFNAGALSASNATHYLGSFDAVLGIECTPDGKLLCYVNGGPAFGGVNAGLNFGPLSQTISETSWGWNLGGGLRWRILPNVELFGQIDWYQLGDKSVNLTDPTTGLLVATSANHLHVLSDRVGLGFHF